jgi:hypothetical protein
MEKQADNRTTISAQKYRTLSENWKEWFMKLIYFQQKNNSQWHLVETGENNFWTFQE